MRFTRHQLTGSENTSPRVPCGLSLNIKSDVKITGVRVNDCQPKTSALPDLSLHRSGPDQRLQHGFDKQISKMSKYRFSDFFV